MDFIYNKVSEFMYQRFVDVTAGVSSLSYWICLLIAIACVLLGMAGINGAKKLVSGSIIIYIIIQCILSVA